MRSINVTPSEAFRVKAFWTNGRSAFSSTTYYSAQAEVIAINRSSVRVWLLEAPYAFQGSRIDGKWWGSTVYNHPYKAGHVVRVPVAIDDHGYSDHNRIECCRRTYATILERRKQLAA